MNKSNGTFALASNDERIVMSLLARPADSALNLIHFGLWKALSDEFLWSLDRLGFFELLLVEFLRTHVQTVTPEVLNSEPDSSELDGIELLNLVVILAILIFQASSNKPQSVDGLLLDLVATTGMVQIIALGILFE